MIYTIKGELVEHGENFIVIECGGIGFKVFANRRTSQTTSRLSQKNQQVKLFCFLYLREEQIELYGFLDEQSLKLFEMLNSVAGVGPKTALGILDIDTAPNIMAAILEKRTELLTRTSGIGRKTAERIILELHGKIKLPTAKALTKTMDLNFEVEEALVGLGYSRSQAKQALSEIEGEAKTLEEKLRLALKSLGRSH